MKRITRAALALAVGALAALATPAVAAQATVPTLSGSASCAADGWKATFTFVNKHPYRTAIITDVDGDLDPAVPLAVAPAGGTVSDTTGVLAGKSAWLHVRYYLDDIKATPPAPDQATSPADVESLTLKPGKPGGEESHDQKWLKVKVNRCSCPTATPTTTPPTTQPTATPTTTRPTQPTTSPTTTAVPTTQPPTTDVPDSPPTTTPPVIIGGAAGGSDSLPLTGAPVAYAVGGGSILLAAGIALVLLLRRRRTTFSA